MPAYLRRNAGRAYDQSVLGGHEYYGMVYVYEDRLEKVSGGTVNRVYYGENAAYIETGDMMVLLASSSRAIVLPARCMTREDAELVRRTVLPRIPPMRQRLLSKMVPQASQRDGSAPRRGGEPPGRGVNGVFRHLYAGGISQAGGGHHPPDPFCGCCRCSARCPCSLV